METLKKIVVMGGSFNPPTIAHLRLMEAAVQGIDAEMGIFVPVSHAYLKRKMRRADGRSICFSEEKRKEMLEYMCADRPYLSVDTTEFQTICARTFETMGALQEQYPGAELYFLTGADKMDLLANWAKKSDFFERFHALIFAREGVSPKQRILDDENLRKYCDSIVILPAPEGVEGMSSTVVRECLIKQRSAEEFLHPAVWESLQEFSMEDFPEEIDRFKGEYEFLSNSYPVTIEWNGQKWLCAEAAYQAARCSKEADAMLFVNYNAEKAKRRAGMVTPKDDWEEIRLSVMEEILYEKFRQNPDLAGKLKETEKFVLVAGNNGKDTFWGRDVYSFQGENHLGEILMKIRRNI